MLDLEVEFWQAFLPSGLLPNDVRCTLQPRQSSGIYLDDELTSKQVPLELLDEVHDRQNFLTRGAVVPLSLVVRPAGVGDHAFLSSLDMRQHGSNGVVPRTDVQDVSIFIRRHGEHRHRRKSQPSSSKAH